MCDTLFTLFNYYFNAITLRFEIKLFGFGQNYLIANLLLIELKNIQIICITYIANLKMIQMHSTWTIKIIKVRLYFFHSKATFNLCVSNNEHTTISIEMGNSEPVIGIFWSWCKQSLYLFSAWRNSRVHFAKIMVWHRWFISEGGISGGAK